MALPLPIRGDKCKVRILKDGAQVAYADVDNITHSETSQFIEHNLVGEKKPRVDVYMMGYEGTINGLVTNNSIDVLIQEIRDARKAGVALPVINILYTESYPDGTTQVFLFTDVQLTLSNRSSAGANEPITKSLAFKASDLRLVRS